VREVPDVQVPPVPSLAVSRTPSRKQTAGEGADRTMRSRADPVTHQLQIRIESGPCHSMLTVLSCYNDCLL
jgi:hypothetical protein